MAAVRSPAQRLMNRAGDRRRGRDHRHYAGADLLDCIDRFQAAQPGHDGAADRVFHAGNHPVHQTVHQTRAAYRIRSISKSMPRRRGGRSGFTTPASAC